MLILPGDEGNIELADVNSKEAITKASGSKDRIEEKLNRDIDGDGKIGSSNNFSYGTKPPNKVVNVRRRGVGWIFQDFHLVEHLTAIDNVAMALEISGMEQNEAETKAKSALTTVGLDRIDFGPSGGQHKELLLPEQLQVLDRYLADEPTGNLDAEVVANYEIIQNIDQR